MKIVLAGYYGFGNVGDELILSTIVKEFRRTRPGDRLVVLSNKPDDTRQLHGVESCNRWKLRDVISVLTKADRFVLGGGGLFQDKTSLRSLIYYAVLLFLAQRLAKSVALYSVSFETIRFWAGKKILVWLLKNSSTSIYVRDDESIQSLVEWGLSGDRIHRTSDAVFLLGMLPCTARSRDNKKTLFIPRFPAPSEGVKLYRTILGELLRLKIPVAVALFQPSREWDAWRDFKAQIPEPLDLVEWSHPSQLLDILCDSQSVISARFHGLVLAELAGIPSWGIGSQDKAGRFCREWSRPFLGWRHHADDVTAGLRRLTESTSSQRNSDLDRVAELARTTFADVFSPSDGNS